MEEVLLAPIRGEAPIAMLAIYRGTASTAHVDASLAFRLGLAAGADRLLLCHNHVSGGPPSADDAALTRRLVALGAVLGLPLAAHLVVTRGGWYNCCEAPETLHPWKAAAPEAAVL